MAAGTRTALGTGDVGSFGAAGAVAIANYTVSSVRLALRAWLSTMSQLATVARATVPTATLSFACPPMLCGVNFKNTYAPTNFFLSSIYYSATIIFTKIYIFVST